MAIELPIEVGADLAVVLELDDVADAAITTYLGTETLSCACWRGDDQATLFSPAVAWTNAPAGQFSVSVSAAQSATLTPGRYDLQLTITSGGLARKKTFGWLAVKPSPGTGTARPVYQTWDETRRYAGSWLDKLQRADVDQTGFAEERADAREEFDRLLQEHYRGTSTGLGASFGAYSPWSFRRAGFKDKWLQQQLDANLLIVTSRIKECCALMTIANICRRQIAPEKDNGYRAAAGYFAGRADDIAATINAEIDTATTTGYGIVIISLGTVDSLRG